jgi:hypothetical protein
VLEPGEDVRYTVRIAQSSNGDDADGGMDDDRDYLEEISDQLECDGGFDDGPLGGENKGVDEPVEYDLCSECRKRFSLEAPTPRVRQSLDFSEN